MKTSVLHLKDVPRALAARDTRGLIKLVAEEGTGRLLGAHVPADEAGEVIEEATLAIRFGLTIKDIVETFHPYPTMVEGLKLAALTLERDVAKLFWCATQSRAQVYSVSVEILTGLIKTTTNSVKSFTVLVEATGYPVPCLENDEECEDGSPPAIAQAHPGQQPKGDPVSLAGGLLGASGAQQKLIGPGSPSG